MDILIGLVIAFMVIVGVFVGYHASQQVEEVEAHDISIEFETLNESTQAIQILQKPGLIVQNS